MLLKIKGLCLIIILAIVIAGCGPAQAPAGPTPEELATPLPVKDVPTPGDGAWVRIQKAGKLVVGVSADYPPFAAYNSDFKLDGFDVALIRQMASALNMPIELKDIAFDGLPAALQTGQIDAAIAAISITPERENSLDFSGIYFVSSDAVLGRADGPLKSLGSVDELASYRMGVQKGSIYEKWIRTTLVEPGKLAEDNLQAYTLIDQALKDLQAGRVDFVLMDLQPAQVAARQFGFILVAQDLNRQMYAIAVKPGSASLQKALNQALIQLQEKGEVVSLARQYMGDSSLLPTPTAQVTPSLIPPTPVVSCLDSMTFVADLNLPDQNMTNPPSVNSNTQFSKGWRILNSGTCTWDMGYVLAYAGSWPTQGYMMGSPVRLQAAVPPGATMDIYAQMIAPPYPGIYQSFWTMRNRSFMAFGNRLYAGISVPAYPTPQPYPSATPDKSVSFSADKTSIYPGDLVTFSWNAAGARHAYFGLAGAGQPVPLSGTNVEAPLMPSNYELRAVYADGSQKVRQIQISVIINPTAPVITRFDVQPPDEIALGTCVDISWEIVGSTTQVTLQRNADVLSDGAPTESALRDCPPQLGDYTYTLTARGIRQSTQARQFLRVVDVLPTFVPGPTQEPFPTFVPEPTQEPFPTFAPEPTEEPFPTFAPEPTEEPLPTFAPEPTDAPEPVDESSNGGDVQE